MGHEGVSWNGLTKLKDALDQGMLALTRQSCEVLLTQDSDKKSMSIVSEGAQPPWHHSYYWQVHTAISKFVCLHAV